MDTIVIDNRPHCGNGWGPTRKHPACNYTGGHFCKKLRGHVGRCTCACGCTTKIKPPKE